MKMEFEIPDEEIDLFLSAMSQAIYSYRNIAEAAFFNCDMPMFMLDLFKKVDLDNDYLGKIKYTSDRFKILKEFYQDIVEKYDKMEDNKE